LGVMDTDDAMSIDELVLAHRVGSGSHSHAYMLAGELEGEVAVICKDYRSAPGPDVSDHFSAQVAYMREIRARRIAYRGSPVAPEVSRFVIDPVGFNIGYVLEYIPGEDLRDFGARSDVSRTLLETAIDDARRQLTFLHEERFVHGDPNPGNVRVQVDSGTLLKTQWFDFEPGRSPLYPEHNYTREDDLTIFARNAEIILAVGYRETYLRLK